MSHCRQTRRFIDDDDLRIDVAQDRLGAGATLPRLGRPRHLDALTGAELPGRVATRTAGDTNLSALQQARGVAARQAEAVAEPVEQRVAGLAGANGV